MKITIRAKNIELTPALKEYVEEKVGRLDRFLDNISHVDVALTVERNRSIERAQRAEVTMHINGNVIRGEEASVSMYSSVDIVVDKLERQLKKYKSRIYTSMRERRTGKKGRPGWRKTPPEAAVEEAVEVSEPFLARTKRVALRPMTPTEAALQMELLGHDFHLFLDSESGGVNLVYRRHDGNYGLIVPEATS